MVGARASPNNRPVRTAPSRVTDRPVLRRTSFCSARLSGFGLEKGTNRWHNARPAPGSRHRATSAPPRWPTSSMSRPRRSPVGHRRASCPSSRPSVGTAATPRSRSVSSPTTCGRSPPASSVDNPARGGHSAHVVHGTVLASWAPWAVPSSRRNGPGPRTRCWSSRNRPASSITVP